MGLLLTNQAMKTHLTQRAWEKPGCESWRSPKLGSPSGAEDLNEFSKKDGCRIAGIMDASGIPRYPASLRVEGDTTARDMFLSSAQRDACQDRMSLTRSSITVGTEKSAHQVSMTVD